MGILKVIYGTITAWYIAMLRPVQAINGKSFYILTVQNKSHVYRISLLGSFSFSFSR